MESVSSLTRTKSTYNTTIPYHTILRGHPLINAIKQPTPKRKKEVKKKRKKSEEVMSCMSRVPLFSLSPVSSRRVRVVRFPEISPYGRCAGGARR